MEIESKIKETRDRIRSLNQELAALLNERDAHAYMSLSEDAISEIYEDETDLYSIKDLKVRSVEREMCIKFFFAIYTVNVHKKSSTSSIGYRLNQCVLIRERVNHEFDALQSQ